ncbi:mitotic spindle checkpoint protein [Teratosphaeria destructans]|uniref:Mitotic spindle checkpoint protein n=1 Tax=Teratosphaeria destructans TaxID=418781 RepID=A0A9W7W4C7_9PEZI|nr:mitotic spindle checkpoint protein [Teratosphaeria destructans]
MAHDSPTFRTLITTFTDFLTVAIHTILYERKLYPQTSFLSARKFNFAVRQSRHPKVCEWINDAVGAVETELCKGTVDRIAVMIYTKEAKATERFVFDVSAFPAVPVAEMDTPLNRTGLNGEKMTVLPTVDMEEQFRATMTKLTNCGSILKILPDGCTFTVAIELKGDGNAPIGPPHAWMPVQQERRDDGGGDGRAISKAVPLRSVAAGEMVFETWIEEAE